MTRQLPPTPPREGLIKVLDADIDQELLDRALTHRSYAYEKGGLPTNERLEFLGDAVLGLVVTAALFLRHPDLPEGQLAKQRASVVNMRALAAVARGIGPTGLGPYLLLGRGEETTGGRDKASILADTLEAIIGAVYLSAGLDVASDFVHRLFDPLLDEAAGRGAGLDWKTSLQEQTALLALGPPEYVVAEAGPDHAKRFTAFARIAGEALGEGEGGSKKEAEQRAAAAAFAVLERRASAAAQQGDADAAAGGAPAGPAVSGTDGAGAASGVRERGGDVPAA
ncbi:Ribonuclease 3 [Frankia canadensis]|uniref:Ribonuclease 3 n=1 Tax=Frankia canadensis TaxID=1836972 RepID=A0A2I2KJA1_9ACTN|nr:ribonuclease III [Frankia canadensis]SNQ45742.1 Ribonuclease 3 [Frankia canadensis]SOU53032.1 Ribonuclease 3 [Frankia canadensis]